MENSNQSTRLDYWRSFKSLLCAVPIANRDNNHKNVMDLRLKLSSAKDSLLETPHLFPKIIERNSKSETIGWVDTSYGAYAIVEKKLPILHKGVYRSHDGICVLFSKYFILQSSNDFTIFLTFSFTFFSFALLRIINSKFS